MRDKAVNCSSSAVRSCITRLARGGSFQRLGSSACRFSSARRARALSTSKMPPQQACGLLDLLDDGLDFRAHGRSPAGYVIGCGAARNAPLADCRRPGARPSLTGLAMRRQRVRNHIGEDFAVNAVARDVEVAESHIGAEAVNLGLMAGTHRRRDASVEIEILQAGAFDLGADRIDDR